MAIRTNTENSIYRNVIEIIDRCKDSIFYDNEYYGQIAISPDSKEDAYRLRYQTYLATVHIRNGRERLLRDNFDEDKNSKTIAIYRQNTIVASARVCFFDMNCDAFCDNSLPSAKIFRKEMEHAMYSAPAKNFMPRAIEITKLVRSAEEKSNSALTFILFKFIRYLIIDFDPDVLFASVCGNHIPFYERIGFYRTGDPKYFPGLHDVAANLLVCRRTIHENIQRKLPPMLVGRKTDDEYSRFIRGEIIRIFPNDQQGSRLTPGRENDRCSRPGNRRPAAGTQSSNKGDCTQSHAQHVGCHADSDEVGPVIQLEAGHCSAAKPALVPT